MTRSARGSTREEVRPETEFLMRERLRVEDALVEVTARGIARLAGQLRDAVEYALSTSGKRLRPVLCVAAYGATRDKTQSVPNAIYRLSCALEIIHTYSLIHDDLPCMDDDDLRRGRPTVHRVYGNALATIAGAALLPMAVDVLEIEGAELGLKQSERAALVIELARAAGAEGMVGGQLLDLDAEQREVDATALEGIHRRKTGALLTSALRIGALAGRAGPELLASLTRFGESLGLAFQIADDILDVEGTSAAIGKTTGRDIALSKASYPALFGIDGARKLARERAEEAKRNLRGLGLSDLEAIADFAVERSR